MRPGGVGEALDKRAANLIFNNPVNYRKAEQ
jgi:hypothetical protein